MNNNVKNNEVITCKSGINWFAKQILKREAKLSKYILPKYFIDENEIKRRLTNTLIISNHDVFILDFYGIPFMLRKLNIPLSIIVNEGFITKNGTVFNEMTEKFSVELIPRNGAIPHIIEHIKRGRSVLIFYDYNQYHLLEEKKSIPIIMQETGCKPVYLKYSTNVPYVDRLKYQSSRTKYVKYNIKTFLTIMHNTMYNKISYININVSDTFDDYNALIKNKEFIKPLISHPDKFVREKQKKARLNVQK